MAFCLEGKAMVIVSAVSSQGTFKLLHCFTRSIFLLIPVLELTQIFVPVPGPVL